MVGIHSVCGVVLALAVSLLSGCGLLNGGDPGRIYRVPELTSNDKDLKGFDSHDRINQYAFQFPGQGTAKQSEKAIEVDERQSRQRAMTKQEVAKPDTTTGSPATPAPAGAPGGDAFAEPMFGDLPPGYVPYAKLGEVLRRIKQDGAAFEPGQSEGLLSFAVMQQTTTAYQAALLDRQSRNRLQTIMIQQSDKIVAKHLSSIIGLENEINVLFGVTATSTAAVAGIVSPVGTKNILTAISAIASGSRDIVREQVYQNAFGLAIVDRIVTARRKFLTETINPKRANSIAEYPVDAAIADVLELHNMGSFYEGVAQIRREISLGNLSSQRPTSVPAEVTIQPAALVVKLDKDNAGELDVNIVRTSADAFAIVVKGVSVLEPLAPKTKSEYLEQLAADEKAKTYKYDLRGSGKVTFKFNAGAEATSFDIIAQDATHEVVRKVIQLQRPEKKP